MSNVSDPSIPLEVLGVFRSLERTDGPLVFAASGHETEPDWYYLVLKDGEQETDHCCPIEDFRPITDLFKIDLDAELARVAGERGYCGNLRFDVFFSPTLSASLAKFGIDAPDRDPEQYLQMSFHIAVE